MRSFSSNSKVLIIVVVLFAVCGLSCKQKPSEQADTNIPEPAQTKIETETKTETKTEPETSTNLIELTAPEKPADSVAVTVNGVDITEAEVKKVVQPQLARMAQQNKQLPPAFAQAFEKQIRQQVLDKMIVMKLLDEKVKETNIVVTDEEVTTQIQQIASAQKPPKTVEELKKIVASQGFVFDDWKNELRKQLGKQKLFKSQFPDSVNITEEDAKKHYDENPTQFESKEQVRASHILITPKKEEGSTEATPEEKAKAKVKAEDLLKQIKEGADFAALAKANSDCPSAAKGGDLNFFGPGQMVPPFDKAAFAMEKGKISDLVETRFGYHIIKVTDRKEAGTKSFEQAKAGLILQLTQKKRAEMTQKYVDSLKDAAKIVYPPGKEPTPAAPPMMAPQPR
jgi:peptidyl-prolyl cis-trans isomerase C